MTVKFISDAPTVFRLLKGVVCLYKPCGFSEGAVKYAFLTKICRELNKMDCRPQVNHVSITGDTTKEMRVSVGPSFADHPLAVGPRYIEQDFKCIWSLPLGLHTSGVFLLGLNDGVKIMKAFERAHQLRTFHVHGLLGKATDTFYTDGKVVERSKFQHVTQRRIDKILATMQAAHQRSMFKLSGVDIQSQDAYELAVQGLIRPADPNVTMVYGIKCIEFKPPEFVIEVHSTNESETYLKQMINEIGIKLHSNAVCSGIRCIRHAFFTVHNALLRKHWTLEHVITNLQDSKQILEANPDFYSTLLKTANLQDPSLKESVVA